MNFSNAKSYLQYQLPSARVARRGFLKAAGGAVLGSSFLGCSSESQQAASPPSVMPSNRGKKAAHLVSRKVVYEHNEKYQWNGCGAIVATETALIISWYTGGVKEPTTDNLVVWNRSLDRGKTWSEPVEISNPPGLVRAADPMLWRDSKGVVHFTYATNDIRHKRHERHDARDDSLSVRPPHLLRPGGRKAHVEPGNPDRAANGARLYERFLQQQAHPA